MAAEPHESLKALAEELRGADTPLAAHVADPAEEPRFGPLAAAEASPAAGEYALVVESVREGYLLHYGEPRLMSGHDPDLALLAGDYLYALGIERLAALGDTHAVHALAELIGDCAQLHAEGREGEADSRWQATAQAIAAGPADPSDRPPGHH